MKNLIKKLIKLPIMYIVTETEDNKVKVFDTFTMKYIYKIEQVIVTEANPCECQYQITNLKTQEHINFCCDELDKLYKFLVKDINK